MEKQDIERIHPQFHYLATRASEPDKTAKDVAETVYVMVKYVEEHPFCDFVHYKKAEEYGVPEYATRVGDYYIWEAVDLDKGLEQGHIDNLFTQMHNNIDRAEKILEKIQKQLDTIVNNVQ